jgi:hypothetical protein
MAEALIGGSGLSFQSKRLDPSHRTVHDRIAETIVVKVNQQGRGD